MELIILFGSYARGEWVEDRYVKDGITYAYRSDFDLTAVLDCERAHGRKWSAPASSCNRRSRGPSPSRPRYSP